MYSKLFNRSSALRHARPCLAALVQLVRFSKSRESKWWIWVQRNRFVFWTSKRLAKSFKIQSRWHDAKMMRDKILEPERLHLPLIVVFPWNTRNCQLVHHSKDRRNEHCRLSSLDQLTGGRYCLWCAAGVRILYLVFVWFCLWFHAYSHFYTICDQFHSPRVQASRNHSYLLLDTVGVITYLLVSPIVFHFYHCCYTCCDLPRQFFVWPLIRTWAKGF